MNSVSPHQRSVVWEMKERSSAEGQGAGKGLLSLGTLLRSKRESTIFSLRDFARQMKMSKTQLSELERDVLPNVTVKTLRRLSTQYGIPLGDLLTAAARLGGESGGQPSSPTDIPGLAEARTQRSR